MDIGGFQCRRPLCKCNTLGIRSNPTDRYLQDPEIADLAQHAPALLSSLIQKLESLYMTLAERDPRDPALQIMPVVSKKAKDMRASLLGSVGHGRTSHAF